LSIRTEPGTAIFSIGGNLGYDKIKKQQIELIKNYQQYRLPKNYKKEIILNLGLSDFQTPFTLPVGKIEKEETLWCYYPVSSKSECEKSWREISLNQKLIVSDIKKEDNIFKIHILTHDYINNHAIFRNKTYYSKIILKVSALEENDQNAKWFSDWSFSSEKIQKIVKSKPKFFPTLNLSFFYSAMRDTISDQVRGKEIGIIDIAFKRE